MRLQNKDCVVLQIHVNCMFLNVRSALLVITVMIMTTKVVITTTVMEPEPVSFSSLLLLLLLLKRVRLNVTLYCVAFVIGLWVVKLERK